MNIDSFGGWGEDRLAEEQQQRMEKMNELLKLLNKQERLDIANAGNLLIERLHEPRSIKELKRLNISINKKDKEFIQSAYFPEFVSDFNFDWSESERGQYEQLSPTERISHLLRCLSVVDRMDAKNVKANLRHFFGDYDGFEELINSKMFAEIYQKQYQVTKENAWKRAEGIVMEVMKNRCTDDFESDDPEDEGIMRKVNSKVHQEVLAAKKKAEKMKTGTLGFIGYARKEYENYLLSEEYWKLFDGVKEKCWRQEAFEIMDTCFDNLTNELVDLIDQNELDRFTEVFTLKNWLKPTYKPRINKLIKKVMDKTGLTDVKNVEELRKTEIFKLAESIQFKISRDRARLEARQQRKTGRLDK